MKVKELIIKLQNLKPELQEVDIQIIAPNGIAMEPMIIFDRKEIDNIDLTIENLNRIIIGYQD